MAPNVNVAIVLGDPRLPYSYTLDGKFGDDELQAVEELKEALPTIHGFCFHYLDKHETLIDDLRALRPDLALNLCDTGFRNEWYRSSNVPALLEILNIPYTGATPSGIMLSDDKALSHAAASLRGVPVPSQTFIDLTLKTRRMPQSYPAFIKPNLGMGSYGVGETSIVNDDEEVLQQLERLAPVLEVPEVIAQEFLPGAEYTIGLIGNPETNFTVLPPLEIDFTRLDPELPKILTYDSKANPDSPYWQALRFQQAQLSSELIDEMVGHCTRIFHRLGLRDYARFDFRCDNNGHPRLIDVNCNPTWYKNGKMAMMAAWMGYSYAQFLRLILQSALRRSRTQ